MNPVFYLFFTALVFVTGVLVGDSNAKNNSRSLDNPNTQRVIKEITLRR